MLLIIMIYKILSLIKNKTKQNDINYSSSSSSIEFLSDKNNKSSFNKIINNKNYFKVFNNNFSKSFTDFNSLDKNNFKNDNISYKRYYDKFYNIIN